MKRYPPFIWLLKVRANLIKTIYINFKFFPWKIAKKLPIIIIGKTDISRCNGKIVLKDPPRFAMLVIGAPNPPNTNCFETTFWVNGTLELSDHVRIHRGSSLNVAKGAVLSIGREVLFNVFCKIRCWNNIRIGSYCRFAWDCQIFDSNFHYMLDTKGYTKRHTGSVLIGESCWLGNRATVNKGTVLPNKTIVASGSIVNKDFSQYGESITIGGVPAKYITNEFRRIVNLKKEAEIDKFFKANPEAESYYVGDDPSLFHWY